MKHRIRTLFAAALLLVSGVAPQAASATALSVVSNATSAFGADVVISGANTSKLVSVAFTIAPKPGATAKAISATYSNTYLANAGLLSAGAGTVTLQVFGLYPGYNNTITITYKERSLRTTLTTSILTTTYDGVFNAESRTVDVLRDSSVELDYSYMLTKQGWNGYSPMVLDIDGNVRWITATGWTQNAFLWDNVLYFSGGTSIYKEVLGGSPTLVADYHVSDGVTGFHHNFDPGKKGLLVDVDAGPHQESTILEINKEGVVLETWDISTIVRDAITAGGGNPSGLVRDNEDWFHNNAATYWKQKDTVVISGREDFVIGIGYSDKKIKWILGDTTKAWYVNYPSLRKYSLELTGSSLPPIGEHAVSITSAGNLMLFDNGRASNNQSPAGIDRGYSAPRKYSIDTRRMRATEVWNYEHFHTLYSDYCSSVYEVKNSLLVNYANEGGGLRLVGLGALGQTAFEWHYPLGCGDAWNIRPISLEALSY